MTVRYFDPRAEPSRSAESYDLRIDVGSEPVTLGLISNTFTDARRFLEHLEAALATAVPALSFISYAKPDTSPASCDMRTAVVRECDAVISAYGH